MNPSVATPVTLRADRAWVLRFLRVFLLVFGVAAAWIFLYDFFSRKIHGTTGKAEWIWIEHDLPSREPVAFAAVRDFVPPASRQYAWLSVAAHPEYSVSLNGRVIGSGASGREPTIDRYEIGPSLRAGTNRIVIRARARDGVGAVLASIDYAPNLRNEEATPAGWKITRNVAALGGGEVPWEEPLAIGRPPVGPWNHPVPRERSLMEEGEHRIAPVSVNAAQLSIPEVAVLSGVAVVRNRQEDALVFDFGREVVGTLDFERDGPLEASVIPWRTTLEASEIGEVAPPEHAVLAQGERTYRTPEPRAFRWVIVYADDVRIEAVN